VNADIVGTTFGTATTMAEAAAIAIVRKHTEAKIIAEER
jgi:hypothetical protein